MVLNHNLNQTIIHDVILVAYQIFNQTLKQRIYLTSIHLLNLIIQIIHFHSSIFDQLLLHLTILFLFHMILLITITHFPILLIFLFLLFILTLTSILILVYHLLLYATHTVLIRTLLYEVLHPLVYIFYLLVPKSLYLFNTHLIILF